MNEIRQEIRQELKKFIFEYIEANKEELSFLKEINIDNIIKMD